MNHNETMDKMVELLDDELIDYIICREMKKTWAWAEDKKDRKAARRMHNYYVVAGYWICAGTW